MRTRTHRLLIAIVLLTATGPGAAQAQGWLEDRAEQDGRGVRLGDLELHAGAEAEGGYQNNVFFDEGDPEGSAILRVTPALYLTTLGSERRGEDQRSNPPKVSFKAGVSGSAYSYLNAIKRAQYAGDMNLDLVVLPERPFSFGVGATATRTIRPVVRVENPNAVNNISQPQYGRNRLQPEARVMLSSRSGILKTELAGGARLESYDGEAFDAAQTRRVNGRSLTSWEFLPKTALFEETLLTRQEFTKSVSNANRSVMRNDGLLLENRVGVNGAITPALATTLDAGYTAGFFSDDNDVDGLTAQAALRWAPAERLRARFAYSRKYNLAYQGNHIRNDHFDVGFDALLAGVLMVRLTAGLSLVDYGIDTVVAANAGSNVAAKRSDLRYDAGLSLEYRMLRWLSLTGSTSYQTLDASAADGSDFLVPPPASAMGGAGESVDWTNIEGWLGLRAYL